jgi:hypothetical protein
MLRHARALDAIALHDTSYLVFIAPGSLYGRRSDHRDDNDGQLHEGRDAQHCIFSVAGLDGLDG